MQNVAVRTYFTNESAMKRFYLIIGNTDDDFCNDSYQLVNLKWIVHDELKAQGYERIIFYDNSRVLYFFDEKSREATFNSKKNDIVSVPSSKWDKSKMQRGPLCGNLIRSAKVAEQNTEGNFSDTRNTSDGLSPLHSGRMNEETSFRTIIRCIQDDKIKTAVVFTNAHYFITSYANRHDRLSCLTEFVLYALGNNYNILVFIFHDFSYERLNEIYNNNDVWNQLFVPRITEGSNVIEISSPNGAEIRNLLNYLRLQQGIEFDMSHTERLCLNLQCEIASITEQGSHAPLKYLFNKLVNNWNEKKEKITLSNCVNIVKGKETLPSQELLSDSVEGPEDEKTERSLDGVTASRLKPPTTNIKEKTEIKRTTL
ncbi:hypothetical protein FACS1894216_13580 [Synergistales bacterium]|nr:hypothetical protein FACS1894216_13580 [Synergistales bacterium]